MMSSTSLSSTDWPLDGRQQAAGFATPVRAQLMLECAVMLRHALASGKPLPQPITDWVKNQGGRPESEVGTAEFMELHATLLQIVAPATPGGLALIEEDRQRHPRSHNFGPLPSVRYLMLAALGFSVSFILVSVSPNISQKSMTLDILGSSNGQLAWVLGFLLSAAGLGAAFGALFDAYQKILDGSYDDKLSSIYWTRIGLGLISGLVLAELIPPPENGGSAMGRPLLAFLGGFSAAVVHRILERLVSALESIFVPEPKAEAGAAERDVRQRVAHEQGQQRTALASSFNQLLDHVAAGGSVDEARKGLVSMLADPSALSGQLVKIGTDAAVGLATGGVKGAERQVVSDIEDALTGDSAQAAGTGIAGTVIEAAEDLAGGSGSSGGVLPLGSAGTAIKALAGSVLGSTPLGLVSTLVGVAWSLGSAGYARWVARVLSEPYRPDLLPADILTPDSAIAALRLAPLCGRAFGPELADGDRLALENCARAAAGPDAGFLGAYQPRFASPEECAAGLKEFRRVLLDGQVTADLAAVLPADGLTADQLLKAGDDLPARDRQTVMTAIAQGKSRGWDRQTTETAAKAALQSSPPEEPNHG